MFGEVFRLTEEGWRKLTLRWAFFFTFLAVLNEVVWRYVLDGTWVSFKVFGIMPLTMAFAWRRSAFCSNMSCSRSKSSRRPADCRYTDTPPS